MAGLHAGAVRRALSFGLDLALSLAAAALAVLAARALGRSLDPLAAGAAACLLCFVAVPAVSRGRTPAQGLLRLRTVRPDASPARWYQYLARYGLLLLFATLPAAALALVLSAGSHGGEAGAVARFVGANRAFFTGAWAVLMAAWAASLVVRAVRSSRARTPFVMLNGLMSNTRVMTEEGARMERERRRALDVEDVVRLERMIAEDGTPLAELMERAGRAVAQKVVDWVPDPAPVTVLAGAGNNGGDGWVAARALAERGYPVTLVTPDIAERLRAEPARATALDVFADAAARRLPLRVLVAPTPTCWPTSLTRRAPWWTRCWARGSPETRCASPTPAGYARPTAGASRDRAARDAAGIANASARRRAMPGRRRALLPRRKTRPRLGRRYPKRPVRADGAGSVALFRRRHDPDHAGLQARARPAPRQPMDRRRHARKARRHRALPGRQGSRRTLREAAAALEGARRPGAPQDA